ncbi:MULTISPECIES: hypothetical protein [Halococcus]|jgi:hypothetical protein|nr:MULTISPECIES: hypothetical protein [Halococcus]
MNDGSRAVASVARWWSDLDGGWRAVLLGTVLVAVVLTGIRIPW